MAKAKELTTTQKAIALVTVVSLTVYSCINIGLVANAYAKLEDNVSEFADIISNWQQYSIKNIEVVDTCSTGYEPLSTRAWPGTTAGCWCGNATSANLNYYNVSCSPFCSSTCSSTYLTAGCNNVPAYASVALNYLGQSGTNKKICVQRTQDTWAKSGPLVTSSGDCPSGYLKCGTGDYAFCVSDPSGTEQCPITSITVDSACTGANCFSLSMEGATRTFRFSRTDSNVLPLGEFKLDEYGLCKTKDEDNVTPSRSLFYLLASKPTTCNSEGDYKWNTITSIREDYLFQYNSLTSTITALEAYDQTGMNGYYATSASGASFTWKLFSKNFIPWKTTCRNRMQDLIDKKTFVDNMKTSQLALLVIAIISTVFMGVPLAVMEVQNLRGVDLSCIDGKGEEERTKLKRFKKFVTYGFKGLQLPFQIWAIIITGSAKALLTSVSNDECSNNDTNTILAYIAKTTNSTFSSTLSALGILVATLLLDIILEVWEKRKAKKEKENAVSPTSKEEKLELAHIDDNEKSPSQSSSPLKFSSPTPAAPQTQTQPQAQPQAQVQPNIVIQFGGPPQQNAGYPPQQYPPQQYPPQQYPPQQYPPQQYPPQQYPPQQYPPQGYPQQQYPPRY